MGETVEDIVQKYLTPEVLAAVLAVVLAVFLTMVMKGKDDLKSQLISARKEIRALCDTINCGASIECGTSVQCATSFVCVVLVNEVLVRIQTMVVAKNGTVSRGRTLCLCHCFCHSSPTGQRITFARTRSQ